MNSAFVGYEELGRSRRVLSTDDTLLDLLNSSYPTQPHSLIAKYSLYLKDATNLARKFSSNGYQRVHLGEEKSCIYNIFAPLKSLHRDSC